MGARGILARGLVAAAIVCAATAPSADAVTIAAATTKLSPGGKARLTFEAGAGAHDCQIAARAGHARFGPLRYAVSQPLVVVTGQVPRDARTLTWTLSVRCASDAAQAARARATTVHLHVTGRRHGAAVLFARGSIHVRSYPAGAVVGAEPEQLKGGKGGYDCGGSSYIDASSYCTGYCTWFVWQKRPEAQLRDLGNAWEWWGGAKARGIPEGSAPVVGAVAWWGISTHAPEGHVAYVIGASASSVTIEEMNRVAWDVADTRTISLASSEAPNGYIYGGPAGSGPGSGSAPGSGSSSGGGGGSVATPPSASSGERPLAVGSHEDGEQDVFWEGQDRNLWETFWGGSSWNGPFDIGMGPLGSSPAVAVRPWGEQDVFWKGTDGNLWETWWSGERWNGPVNLGMGPLGSQPTAAAWGQEVDVFWRGTDGDLWEAWYDNNVGVWNGPVNLGMGPLNSAPTAGAREDGEQVVFWRGTDNNLWETWWSGERWNGPAGLGMGPLASAPTVAVRPSGEQEVFWDGTDGNLWEALWNGTSWVGATGRGMGTLGSAPSATAWGTEVDVFWGGTDANIWEGLDNGSGWFGPYDIGMGPIG